MEAISQYGSSDEEQDVDHLHRSSQTQQLNAPTSDPTSNTTTQGRIRRFPHVPGNFAVHVFIKVPTIKPCRPPLENLLQQVKQMFPDFSQVESLDSVRILPLGKGGAPLLAQPSYHVSLSRTLPIRLVLAEPLLTSLRNNLHQVKRFSLRIHPVLEVFLNDDKTRTFLALKVSAKPVLAVQLLLSRKMVGTGEAALEDIDPLLQAIDAVSDAFEMEELQRFYSSPKPHISLGWLLGDQSAALSAAFVGSGVSPSRGEERKSNIISEALRPLAEMQWEVEPEVIWCKIGQVNHSIWKKDR
ncbi:hypothetical protein Ndes2526A_g00220 [Nannochloris sp. 'desiccata']